MLQEQELLHKIYKQTGTRFIFVRDLGKGFNNRAVLLKDEAGNRVVCRYGLDKDANNPFVKVFYKFKRLRRKCITSSFLKNMPKQELVFIKQNYKDNLAVQQLARNCSSSVYVPKTIKVGKFTLEEYCGEPIDDQLTDSSIASMYARQLGGFLADLHNNCAFSPNTTPIYKKLTSHLGLANTIYKLKGWQSDYIPSVIKENLNNSLLALKIMGNADEIRSVLHNDLRIPNLLMHQSGKLAVIDWDRAGVNNIYYEFAQFGGYTNGMPAQFIKDCVNYYNKRANNKIDLTKLKHLLIVWHIDECCWRNIIDRKNKTQFIEALNSKAVPQINKINQVFNSASSVQKQ